MPARLSDFDRRHQDLGPDGRHHHPVHALGDEVLDDRHLLGRHVFGIGGDHLHAQLPRLILDVFLGYRRRTGATARGPSGR